MTTSLSLLLWRIPGLRRLVIRRQIRFIQENPAAEVDVVISGNLRMKLSVADWVQKHLFLYGEYEHFEIRLWRRLARKAEVIIDAGANVGYYSLQAAKVNPEAKIIAFEPVARTHSRFLENISLNDFKNITPVKAALSNYCGELEINLGTDENWGMSGTGNHVHLSGKSEKVPAITLDSYFESHNPGKAGLIKIDVEGSELSVLEGMKEVLKKYRPDVMVEVLEVTLTQHGHTVADVYAFFQTLGYSGFLIKARGLKHMEKPVSCNGLTLFRYEKP